MSAPAREPYTEPLEKHEAVNVARAMRCCIHFNGIGDILGRDKAERGERRCAAGVRYEDVKGDSVPGYGGPALPCFKDRAGHGARSCEKAEFLSREAALASEREHTTRLLARFAKMAAGECPTCNRPVTMRQVGPCVYGDCGHRMYHGKLKPQATR